MDDLNMATTNKHLLDITPKLCQLTDRFGNTFHYGNAGDFWFPPFPIGADTDYRTHVRNIRSMDIREDDVIIATYPKTGTHWHAELVSMLMTGRAKYHPELQLTTALDFLPIERVDAQTSPRILLTHIPFRHLPKQLWAKKVKILNLVRNPKDVLVSWYSHIHSNVDHLGYEGSFEEFFTLCMECGFYYGDLFDYMMEWQAGIDANPDVRVYTCVYEDILMNPVTAVERLNDYLGTGCSEQLCKDIAEACQFDKLKAYMDSTRNPAINALFKDPNTSFYRKGIAGDWKNWFTPKLLEIYDTEYKRRMADYRIHFS